LSTNRIPIPLSTRWHDCSSFSPFKPIPLPCTVRNCVIASRFHARLSCRPSVRGYNKGPLHVIPPKTYTYISAMIPGLFFELSILVGNPAYTRQLLEKARAGFALDRYMVLAIALFSAFVIGNGFMLFVGLIQRFLGLVYRVRAFCYGKTLQPLGPCSTRAVGGRRSSNLDPNAGGDARGTRRTWSFQTVETAMNKLVEAGGVEPPSEKRCDTKPTCLAQFRCFRPPRSE